MGTILTGSALLGKVIISEQHLPQDAKILKSQDVGGKAGTPFVKFQKIFSSYYISLHSFPFLLLGGEKFIVNGLFFKYPIDKQDDKNHFMCVFTCLINLKLLF